MNREKQVAATFVELAETLVEEFDAVDVMHTLSERIAQLLAVDAAGLILADQRGRLQVVASTTHQAQDIELLALQNHEGPCLDCFNVGQAVVNTSVEEATNRWPRFTASALEVGYRSSHALPLRLRREVIGAVSLFSKRESPLSAGDLVLGQALADVSTICLLQERAVQQKELLAEQLQTALNTRVLIEQAKGSLAERAHVNLDQAFDIMRGFSRRTRQPIRAVAASVIDGTADTAEIISTAAGAR